MDDMFERILKKLEEHKKTHIKIMLPERKKLIKNQYDLFSLEFEEVPTSYIESATATEIELFLDLRNGIVSCDDGGSSFNALVGLANCTQINLVDDGIIQIKLWFRLWEWVDK